VANGACGGRSAGTLGRLGYSPGVPRSPVPRPLRLPLLVAAVLVATGAALLLGTGGSGTARPTPPAPTGPPPGVTIGPTDALVDGQIVSVRGAGLPAGLEVLVAPCDLASLEAGRFGSCDLDVAARTTTDDDGAFSVGYRVARTIRVLGDDLDCAVVRCVLSVIRSGASLVELAREPLGFVADETPRATVSVLPRSDLSHRSPLRVRASGFADRAVVRQCAVGAAVSAVLDPASPADPEARWCDPATTRRLLTDDGVADLVVTALRVLVGPDGAPLDCLAVDLHCELDVTDGGPGGGAAVVVRLWFSPTAPPPGDPSLLAAPTVGLGDRDEVQVLVAELLAAPYALEVCPATDPPVPATPTAGTPAAGCTPVATVQGPVGTGSVAVVVPRIVGPGTGTVQDCAAAPGCVLRLRGPHPRDPAGAVAVVPLTFDPLRPLVLPLVVVEPPPATDASAPVVVRVLAPGDVRPTLSVCATGAGPDDPAGCRAGGEPVRQPDGTWRWDLVIPASVGGASCPAGCDVVVAGEPGYPPVRTPIGKETPGPT
jgi:hypothetical protein